jgi:two-component system, cell cycle response regulator
MDLVRASLGMRRVLRGAQAPLVAIAMTGVVLSPWMHPIVLAPFGALVVVLAARKIASKGDASLTTDVGLALVASSFAVACLAVFEPRFDGPLAATVYLLVALLAAFTRPLATAVAVFDLLGTEALLRYVHGELGWEALGLRALLVCAFAMINVLCLRAELARIRRAARSRIDHELKRIEEDARSYRLLGAGEPEARSEERLARSSVEEIQRAVHYALDLLRRTLDLHTAALFWLNDAGSHLRITELATGSDDIHDAPIAIRDGVLAAVIAQKERVLFSHLKPSSKVPYYEGPCPVRVLLAMPILEDTTLRGILVLDRTKDVVFTPHEEELAAQAARYCLRAIQNERIFVQLERAKVEQGKLYEAAKALGAALSERDVLDAGVKAAQRIAAFDLAAVTLYDEATHMHEVVAATGEIEDLVGSKLHHNQGLVSMVVKNKFPLPYRGEYDASRQVVLTKSFPWPKVPSLLVLPLLHHERALGTLILGAKRRGAFGDSVRPTLEVLATHLAVSLANARMVAKLEQMATTDGLTGLLNKRAMLEAATQKIAAAARFGRCLSLLVVDIDFFKKVNDTHGHDVGDVVIKGLGDILRRQKRTTDLVARFGGEEFIVLCEQTDEAGAMLLAERIREDLEKTTFHVPGGAVKVTCSLGTSTFPEAGRDWESLFKAADDALYASKRGGRNRSTAAAPRSVDGREKALLSKRKVG